MKPDVEEAILFLSDAADGQILFGTATAKHLRTLLDAYASREAALTEIAQWAAAYPLKVFPEPDFVKSAEVLSAAGLSLDRISASNMRHVVEGVGAIARRALSTYVTNHEASDGK